MSLFIKLGISLCNIVVIFLICCEITNLICYDRILRICLVNNSVRSLNKTILIDSRISCKRVDKSDIRTLRGLNRTHSAIMSIVNISNLESGTVS